MHVGEVITRGGVDGKTARADRLLEAAGVNAEDAFVLPAELDAFGNYQVALSEARVL